MQCSLAKLYTKGKKRMVVIRLSRGGSKKRPFYHLVAADKRRARDSRYIERLGYYNPTARGQELKLNFNQERVDYWLGEGAQASDRVKALLKQAKKDAASA
ncbi:ribosomal protein S16 [gamma proteobacterium HTCC5015]|nr:ribosomal protein S16 [gamma proteobacterium HTCC5015]